MQSVRNLLMLGMLSSDSPTPRVRAARKELLRIRSSSRAGALFPDGQWPATLEEVPDGVIPPPMVWEE